MKFILNIIFLLSFLSFGANAQGNGAIFKFQEETHDFGNVLEGPAAVYNFEFTNSGNEPLVIQNCSASCGCNPHCSHHGGRSGRCVPLPCRYATARSYRS